MQKYAEAWPGYTKFSLEPLRISRLVFKGCPLSSIQYPFIFEMLAIKTRRVEANDVTGVSSSNLGIREQF